MVSIKTFNGCYVKLDHSALTVVLIELVNFMGLNQTTTVKQKFSTCHIYVSWPGFTTPKIQLVWKIE